MPRTPVEVRDWNSRTSVAIEADRLAVAGGEQDVVVLGQQRDADQAVGGIGLLVAVVDLGAFDAVPKRIAILPAVGMLVNAAMLLRRTVPCAVANMMCRPPHSSSSSGSGRTVEIVSPSRKREQVDHRPALGVRAALGQAPDLHPVDPAEVGEEQHRIVGRGDEQVGDRVLFLGRHAGAALAAALLLAEHGERRALDVAVHGHGHDHVLALDQVLVLDAVGGGGELATCAA